MRFRWSNKLFAKRGGDTAILVCSLLLAFFMWSMHRMTKRYSAVFDYKIELSSNIEGRAQKAVSHNSLVLRGRASGFFIFQQEYTSNVLPLSVDAKQLKQMLGERDMFYIKSADIQNMVQEVLGNDIQLENVTSDTLYFQFPRQANKKVPVIATENISFEQQYTAVSDMTLRPDSVVVYGNEDVVSSIEAVHTRFIRANKVSETVQGIVGLQEVNGVRFSDENIYYSLDVVRYFESSVTVKPTVINVPYGSRAAVMPQEITLFYRMQFVDKKEIDAQDFTVIVDYNSIEEANIVKPQIIKQPNGIFDVRTEPKFLECIIN